MECRERLVGSDQSQSQLGDLNYNKINSKYMDFRELIAYKKAFKLAMEIYKISKLFPKEERYSPTDQIRRSSRTTCANIAESYRKRI